MILQERKKPFKYENFFNQKDFQEQNIFCMNEKRISRKSNLKEHSFNSYVDFQIKKKRRRILSCKEKGNMLKERDERLTY